MKKIFITSLSVLFLGSCTTFFAIQEVKEKVLDKVSLREKIDLLIEQIFIEEQAFKRIDIANDYEGLHEKKDREQLKEFLGVDPVTTEWCAAFVNAVLKEQGIEGTGSLVARSFTKWGDEVDEPKYGDIVVFPRGSSTWQGHVGFYVDHYTQNGEKYYIIIGGNQDDEVNFSDFKAKEALSVRRAPLGEVN